MATVFMSHDEMTEHNYRFNRANGDTEHWIIQHVPSGELYGARVVSVWESVNVGTEDDPDIRTDCVGLTVSDVTGPLYHRDVQDADGAFYASDDPHWQDLAGALDDLNADDDAPWASEQEWEYKHQIQTRVAV